jgi:hypothetical protein
LRAIFHPATEFVAAHKDNPKMSEFTKPLYQAIGSAQNASLWIAANGMGNPDEAAAGSSEYLRLMALMVFGYMWAMMAEVSLRKLEENPSDKEFYENKLHVARFYMSKILPYHYGHLASIVAGSKTTMAMADEAV